MKRYAAFDYYSYYPSGGWNDLTGLYDTADEAIAAVKDEENPHVVDLQAGKVIWPEWAVEK